MSKPDPSSSDTSKDEPRLNLPEFCEESLRLMETPPPTLAEQIAHAQMLIRWRREQGLPPDDPPRNPEPFRL